MSSQGERHAIVCSKGGRAKRRKNDATRPCIQFACLKTINIDPQEVSTQPLIKPTDRPRTEGDRLHTELLHSLGHRNLIYAVYDCA